MTDNGTTIAATEPFSSTGSVRSGVGSGIAGSDGLIAGTLPTFGAGDLQVPTTNAVGNVAPTSLSASYIRVWPNTAPAANQFRLVTSNPSSGVWQDSWIGFNFAGSYAAGGGSANAQTAAYNPVPASLASLVGTTLCWLPTAANTTSTPTFSPNSLTAHTIVKVGGASLSNSDLTTTAIACAIWDATNWELQNPQAGSGGAVTSFSGDGNLITNSTSTGAVTATMHTAPAYSYWGNNTGSTGAPGYSTIPAAGIPAVSLTDSRRYMHLHS